MGQLATYSIESAILLTLIFAVYMLVLSRLKWVSLRRMTLLSICVASLSLPLLRFTGIHKVPIYTIVGSTPPIPESVPHPAIYTLIAGIIVTGIFVATIISLTGVGRILRLNTKTTFHNEQRFKVLLGKRTSPFCFFGTIYISEDDLHDLPEMALKHEKSHISHRHFIDLLIGRIVLILQWWNPFAWYLCKEIQRVHEYQADNDVIMAGYDPKEYQHLLLSLSVEREKRGLVSGLRQSELKNRLKMINRKESRRKRSVCLLFILPCAIIGLAIPFSPIVSTISNNFSPITIGNLRELNSTHPDSGKSDRPLVKLNGEIILYQELNSISPDAIESITVFKDRPDLYPNGVVEIKTKPGMEIFNNSKNTESEEIKVIGLGVSPSSEIQQ